MEGPSAENPLGLPRDNEGGVHQLQLKRLEGTGYERRINTCMDAMGFLATIQNGVVVFNSLVLPHQIAAILITEGDNSYTRLDQFI